VKLQCAIPVFDGLLPEPHNTCVLKVLFDLAHWHGLAKLRMHTDSTLSLLSQVTTTLGNTLRTFQQACAAFPTRELQREQIARIRRQEKTMAPADSGTSQPKVKRQGSSARLPKQLNLRTYKFHSLGDYHYMIQRFGTIDSYSTQPVSFFFPSHKLRYSSLIIYRVNGSTEPPKGGTYERMGDQYPSNCQRSSNGNVASA
jgi:hypothetical protein